MEGSLDHGRRVVLEHEDPVVRLALAEVFAPQGHFSNEIEHPSRRNGGGFRGGRREFVGPVALAYLESIG